MKIFTWCGVQLCSSQHKSCRVDGESRLPTVDGCAETLETEANILGDPSSEQEKAAAEDARKQLEIGVQIGMQMMQEHLSRIGASPSEFGRLSNYDSGGRPGAFDRHASRSGAGLLNVAAVENMRNSMAAELAMDVPGRGRRSTAHFAFDLPGSNERQSMVGSRARGQSVRSVMRQQPPPGTWLVEIDDQVRQTKFFSTNWHHLGQVQ